MGLLELAERVANTMRADNRLDVLVEVALFEPDELNASVRPNAAGTKVIYTDPAGISQTAWAWDWTAVERRAETIASLRARAALETANG